MASASRAACNRRLALPSRDQYEERSDGCRWCRAKNNCRGAALFVRNTPDSDVTPMMMSMNSLLSWQVMPGKLLLPVAATC